VSGTGIVADGCQFPDGTVALRWRGDRASTTVWSSMDDALSRLPELLFVTHSDDTPR
jgi:hypothetical protein